jgi:hypothetical protein
MYKEHTPIFTCVWCNEKREYADKQELLKHCHAFHNVARKKPTDR